MMAPVFLPAAVGGNLTPVPSLAPFLESSRRLALVSASHPVLPAPIRAFSLRLAPAARKKDNVWSVDNDAAAATEAEKEGNKPSPSSRRRRRRPAGVKTNRSGKGGRVLVSGRLLMEVETVLQTQEPVIRPAWDTFASSVSGVWKGVGAVFSPITAEIEPIGMGVGDEQLYDCYTLSHIEKSAAGGDVPGIIRKTNWVAFNPFGEGKDSNHTNMPVFESFDLKRSEVMEEDAMTMDPGLVFFEDGSYSRGPVDLPVGEYDESKYFLSPTFKFEQCLVKGCHQRLRIVHTIEFNEGGANIQIVRVALYEEQWVSPASIDVVDNLKFELKPFSQRRRTESSELLGSWKVFEVSATPIFSEMPEDGGKASFVYLCTETLKKRSLPESSVSFGEEEILDMQDVTVLWLPGGITGYVDIDKDGVLCIGVGWYSSEGLNLVMERDYGPDGKLKDVRWKTELKRRWNDPNIG